MSRKKRRRQNPLGLLLLEAIGITGFCILLLWARAQREDGATWSSGGPNPHHLTAAQESLAASGWQTHRPRFSQVVGDIWQGGF